MAVCAIRHSAGPAEVIEGLREGADAAPAQGTLLQPEPPLDPRSEICRALPASSGGPPPTTGEADVLKAMLRLHRRAADGSADAAAVLAFLDRPAEAVPAAFAKLAPGSGSDLAELARTLDESGHQEDAALLLGVLAGLEIEGKTETANGRLGLGVLAARRGSMDQARTLAAAAAALPERHPRALSLLGICDLEAGNPAQAQAHLATAARLARRDPAFRHELQIAQRALLLMHLKS